MINDYLRLGLNNEIINTARLQTYLTNVGSPFASGPDICSCDSLTAAVLDDPPYSTPDSATSPAPWYDPDYPDSANFLGLLPLSIDGLDDLPIVRSVNPSVSGIGSIGPQRVQPRVITVTALLLGTTCCAVAYGLHWLSEALQGCRGGSCAGDCATMYACCPPGGLTAAQYNAAHRRTFRRVALTSGPVVTARNGTGACGTGQCGYGADILTVEFTLTAGSPWAWTDPTPLLDVDLPGDAEDLTCVTWCLTGSVLPECAGACQYADCISSSLACTDPNCTAADLPDIQGGELCNCLPLANERACYTLDLSTRPAWSSDALIVELASGDAPLRNVKVTLYEKSAQDIADGLTCDQIADANRCNPFATYFVSYVPADGVVTLDGQIGRATLDCGSSTVNADCGPARDVFGADAGPAQFTPLTCAQYCLCVETDVLNPPADNAGMSVSVSGKGL